MKKKSLLALALLAFGFSLSLHAQTIPSPQQTDQIITDPNANGKADPGDKIRYKVTIQNTGGAPATGTTLNAVPDAKTTFSAGSFRSSPLGFDDGPYTCLGNVGITVPDGASDLLANDFDDAPAGLTATAGTFATTQGGSITIAADGSFSYNPPRGFEGTDTYQYTLNDGNAVAGVTATDLGTVTFTVSGMIWFINNNAGACASTCDGRMSNPYTTLAAFNTANALSGGLDPADNDNIFIYESAAAYTGGVALRNGQKLIGQDATVTLVAAVGLILPTFSNPLPVTNSGNGTKVTITNATAGGHGILLASNTTTRGLTVGASAAFAIYDNGALATTTTISEVDINNSTGGGFRAFQDVLSVTFGTFTAAGGTNALNLVGTGGSFAVTGTTTASGQSGDAILINAILLGSTVTFGVTSVTATGSNQAIEIVNNIGSVSFAAGSSVTGSSDDEIFVNGGSGNITYNGSVTNTSGGAISVCCRTSGTVAFTGNISHTGATTGIDVNGNFVATINFSGASKSINSGSATAVSLTSNTGAFINFTGGGLVITTTSGAGFNATGGGTVTVQGTGNTITSTTGTALNVVSTTIGASGLTFQSISAGTIASGPTNGIVLNTTGSSGGLTVTGTGTTDGTGGTIQNTTGRGASFISATSITLKNMNFTNAGTTDLDATNGGLSTGDNLLTNASIHLETIAGTNLLDNLNISGGAEQGINGNTVSNFTLSNSSIVDAGNEPDEDGIHFYNMSGTSAITNTTINCTVATPNTTGGDDHLNLQMQSGTLNLTVSGGSATNANKGSGYLFGIRGTANATITFSSASSTDNFSGGIVADAFDSAIMDLTVSNSTSSGNNDQLSVSAGDNSDVELTATGNTLSSPNTGDFVVVSLLGSAFDTGYDFDASFSSNTITVGNGRTADGFTIFNAGGGAMDIAITNNTINYAGTQRTILVQAGQDGNGSTNVTITGNNIDIELDGTGNGSGILAQSAITGPGNTSSVCADIGGAGALKNTFTHSLGGTIAAGDIRVRQRNDGTVRLPGYAGAATDAAAVITYLGGRNTIVSASTATFDSSGFAGGGACVQPSH